MQKCCINSSWKKLISTPPMAFLESPFVWKMSLAGPCSTDAEPPTAGPEHPMGCSAHPHCLGKAMSLEFPWDSGCSTPRNSAAASKGHSQGQAEGGGNCAARIWGGFLQENCLCHILQNACPTPVWRSILGMKIRSQRAG